MTNRILLAGVLGGIALFVWGGMAHTVLGLGEVGLAYLPQQQPVMDTLKASVPQSGFYFFPQLDAAHRTPTDKMGGPYGIMIYHASGAGAPMTGQLIRECLLDIVMALFAVFLLSRTSLTGYWPRVGFVTFTGLMIGLMTNAQYWNWYGFPSSYTTAAVFIDVVDFLLVGLIAAALVKQSVARMMNVPAEAVA